MFSLASYCLMVRVRVPLFRFVLFAGNVLLMCSLGRSLRVLHFAWPLASRRWESKAAILWIICFGLTPLLHYKLKTSWLRPDFQLSLAAYCLIDFRWQRTAYLFSGRCTLTSLASYCLVFLPWIWLRPFLGYTSTRWHFLGQTHTFMVLWTSLDCLSALYCRGQAGRLYWVGVTIYFLS